jgi:hypothetical protein
MIVLGLPAGVVGAVDVAPPLFHPPAAADAASPGAEFAGAAAHVARRRPAVVRLDALVAPNGSAVATGRRIGLNLFDDASFTATLTDASRPDPDTYTWSGRLDGVDGGHVVLAVRDGAVVGHVTMPGRVFRIGHAPDGTQVVEQVDTAALPPEAEPIVPSLPAGDVPAGAVAGDSASQIDVMIVYTAAARVAAGGTAAIQAEASAAVASANQAYANNGLVQRLRLVFSGEVEFTETGNFNADLSALRNNAAVAALRDTYGADLVSLFVSNGPSAPFCGIGYLMSTNSTSFAPFAFNIVERDCASSNLTFAHELGHNMGAHHDPYVAADPGLFAYSHGHVDLVAHFRTIMSYPNQCNDAGVACPRIPYFSTPNQTFAGRPMGNAAVSDNARTLSQSANAVANFRVAVTAAAPLLIVQRDFNGDGRADVLWRHTSGTVVEWLVNGLSVIGAGSPGTATGDWTIAGAGDFNGDGKTDILWRHATGTVGVWFLDGLAVVGGGSPGGAGSDWTIAGVGDFNGDGRSDILWRHASGTVAVWLLNGLAVIGSGSPGAVGSDWAIAGVGDFNGDGRSDILWRHTVGTVAVWLLDGVAVVGSGSPGAPGSDWAIAGVGDTNADGRDDIVWRHAAGAIWVWLMNGSAVTGTGSTGVAAAGWTLAGVGDFNGDGRADLLWRHASGIVGVWFLDGISAVGGGSLGSLSTDWRIE